MADPSRPRLAARPRVGGDGDPEVFCADEQSDVPLELERWQQLALDVLRDEGVRGLAELSILFVAEHEISELNRDYMGKDGPTDVLAFPIDDDEVTVGRSPDGSTTGPDREPPDDVPLLLGDVVICPVVAARNAPAHAGTYDDEIALLLVHGILHVLGMDHATPDETIEMQARERDLLGRFHRSAS